MVGCEFSHEGKKERWKALLEMWRWKFPHLSEKTEAPSSPQSQPDSGPASPSSSKTPGTQ